MCEARPERRAPAGGAAPARCLRGGRGGGKQMYHLLFGVFGIRIFGFRRVLLRKNLNLMGWNYHVHRGFPGMFESANLSRDNLSREIRRSSCRLSLCLSVHHTLVSTPPWFGAPGALPLSRTHPHLEAHLPRTATRAQNARAASAR